MKRLFGRVLFSFFLIVLVLSNYKATAQKTTVWLVRHAEKAAAMATDPTLTADGQKRADALAKELKRYKIHAIYVTNTKRSKLTAKPLADKIGITPQEYTTTDYKAFAAQLLKDHPDQQVLVVGHSNTIMPIILALGGGRAFAELSDDDYDMLFKLTLKNGKAQLEISYYGDVHHTSTIPEQYSADFNSHYTRPNANF